MIPSVSAIVCAYNEEKTVRPILETLLAHPLVTEVIVVDDGSKDHTWDEITKARHSKLVPLRHQRNLGKGAAVATAVKKSSGSILLFIDADLLKFHPAHIDLLLLPLDIDPTSMTISIREPRTTIDWQQLQSLFKFLNGERALQKKAIVPLLPKIEKSGYGVEVLLLQYFLSKKRHIYYIPLPHLFHVLKQEKGSLYKTILDYVPEITDIVKQYLKLELEQRKLDQLFKKL